MGGEPARRRHQDALRRLAQRNVRDDLARWRVEHVRDLVESTPNIRVKSVAMPPIVIPANTELVNIIGDMAGILPLTRGAVPLKSQASVPAGGGVPGHS